MMNLFKNADSQFSDDFRDHSSNWKKYLADNNPGALEKALDALEAFIGRADPKLVLSSQNDIIKVLIEKCIGHAKASIKTKSTECFNLLFEVTESFDDSLETLSEMLSSKNAKVLLICILFFDRYNQMHWLHLIHGWAIMELRK